MATKEEIFANFKECLLKIVEEIEDEWVYKSTYGYTQYFTFKIGNTTYCVSLCVHNGGGTSFVITKVKNKKTTFVFDGRNVEVCLEAIEILKNKK